MTKTMSFAQCFCEFVSVHRVTARTLFPSVLFVRMTSHLCNEFMLLRALKGSLETA